MSEEKTKNISFSKVKIQIWNKHPLQKNSINKNSKQKSDKQKNPDWIINPQIDFSLLRKTVQSWGILSWIINKIASSCDTGFIPTSNDELNKVLSKIDVYESIRNLFIFWNLFYEVIKTAWWWLDTLDIILTETCKLKEWWDEVWISLIQQSSWTDKVPFQKWEFIHIKRWSLVSKYYWDTIFSECIDSILILYYLDQVYKKLFENWFIEPSLLVDEEAVLTPEQKDSITAFIKDYFKWVDNGFEVWIISWKIKRLELTSKLDHNAFIALRKETKEEIAIALNIPYELLSWKNSNRATRESSSEDFNVAVIKPWQGRYVRQLREGLREFFPNHVDEIELNSIDTKNQEEISNVIDKLIRCWVFTIDMGLEYFWYDPTGIAENNIHKVYGSWASSNNQNDTWNQNNILDNVKKIYKK